MTVPCERYRALIKARDFLRDLMDPKKTPRVPKYIRKKAYWALKHYPWDTDLEMIAIKLPDRFEKTPVDEGMGK